MQDSSAATLWRGFGQIIVGLNDWMHNFRNCIYLEPSDVSTEKCNRPFICCFVEFDQLALKSNSCKISWLTYIDILKASKQCIESLYIEYMSSYWNVLNTLRVSLTHWELQRSAESVSCLLSIDGLRPCIHTLLPPPRRCSYSLRHWDTHLRCTFRNYVNRWSQLGKSKKPS